MAIRSEDAAKLSAAFRHLEAARAQAATFERRLQADVAGHFAYIAIWVSGTDPGGNGTSPLRVECPIKVTLTSEQIKKLLAREIDQAEKRVRDLGGEP